MADRRWPIGGLSDFVFASEDPRRLAAVRIGFFGFLGFRVATGNYVEAAGRPEELFEPISLFVVLEQMPPEGIVVGIQVAGVVSALAAAAGLWPRVTFGFAVASAVFLGLILNAGGKVIHNDVVLILCTLPLVVAPSAATQVWSVQQRTRIRTRPSPAFGWPIRTAMMVIGLAYLFAGLQKLRYSGFDWAASDNLRYILYSASDDQATPNVVGLFVADRGSLAHTIAAGTLFLEIGFLLCLPFARLRWFFVPAAVSLHLGIWLTMHLDYSAQAAAVLIVFVNWASLVDSGNHLGRLGSMRSSPVRRLSRSRSTQSSRT